MKVLVTGSRDWLDRVAIGRELAGLPSGSVIAHGGARGADTLAGTIALTMGYGVTSYPVDTRIDGPWPAAGNRRNERMFNDFQPDLVIAFLLPQSRGTRNMVAYARSKGCEVREVWPTTPPQTKEAS